jgi:preprotein translocase subunit SecE
MAENEKDTEVTTPVAKDASAKTPKVKESKPKKAKVNIFVRFGRRVKKFWKEYVSELKKVVWMSWKDVKKNTLLVVCAVIVFSIAIGLVDTAFGEIIEGIAGLVG